MTQGKYKSEDDVALEKLKDIILRNDRDELEELRTILNDKEKLSEKVNPIIVEHFNLSLIHI